MYLSNWKYMLVAFVFKRKILSNLSSLIYYGCCSLKWSLLNYAAVQLNVKQDHILKGDPSKSLGFGVTVQYIFSTQRKIDTQAIPLAIVIQSVNIQSIAHLPYLLLRTVRLCCN